jgi:hypothetical protein
MDSLMRLFSKAAALAADVARTSIQLAEAVAGAALGRIRNRSSNSPPEPPWERPAPAPPTRARPPRARARPAPPPPVPTPEPEPIAVVPEPTRGQAARIRAEQREAERTADSPGPEIRIDEPWPGYASMKAPEIIDRLRVSDDAAKAVVLLYESSHRARKTVLRAAGSEGE